MKSNMLKPDFGHYFLLIVWTNLIASTLSIDCLSKTISLEDSCLCRLQGKDTSSSETCPSSICEHGTLTYNRTESLLKCLCEDNWEGYQCELIYCKYGHRINKDTCECEKGFQGKNCKEMVCQNNGVSIIENGWTKCSCPKDFAGKRCESKVPDCGKHGKVVWVETSDFVKAKLLTVDPNKKLMCHCDPGYGGELCSVKKTCKNGKLMDTGCVCDHRWTGTYCDVPVCLHGSQVSTGCLCDFGWGGRFCESCLWGEKIGDKCIQYAYSTPARDQSRVNNGPHFQMSWTTFILILIVCSVLFLAVGCWIEPRKHLGICFPALRRYQIPSEQNIASHDGVANTRVVVVQDSGSARQIVVNVVPKNDNAMPRSKTSPPSSGKSSARSNNNESLSDTSRGRRHSTGSKPPSYSKLTQEDNFEMDYLPRDQLLNLFLLKKK